MSEPFSGTIALKPILASITSFTGLANERDPDVLETVLFDHSPPEVSRTRIDAPQNIRRNGATGEDCIRGGMHIFFCGGDCVDTHGSIVGRSKGEVNWNQNKVFFLADTTNK